jgi:prepilin-type processing-associated H-X9-DG protein
MDKDLLGYLLQVLEPHEHTAVEVYLQTHPEARVRLETLRHTLEPLSWDPPETPEVDLAARTMALVAPLELAAASASAQAVVRNIRPGRRLVEAIVATAAVVVAAGVITVWVAQSRLQQTDGKPNPVHIVECSNNLQKLYVSLHAYSDAHGRQLPSVANVTDMPERNVAGLVYPILYDSGVLSRDVSVRCPGAVGLSVNPNSLAEINKMPKMAFECWANHLHHSYAYTLGYKNNGQCLGLRLEDGKPLGQMPLMADSAPLDPKLGSNSPHHGGHGQNVLFCDGHVAFFYSRQAGVKQDDIYLNRAGKVGAGLDWTDAVLSSSLATP